MNKKKERRGRRGKQDETGEDGLSIVTRVKAKKEGRMKATINKDKRRRALTR